MKIDGHTQIFGIIGNPLAHTFSPAMHNAAFAALGINAVYLPFPMENLSGLKHALKQLNIRGLSVTIPHKLTVRRVIDKIDELAEDSGSVNTLFWDKGELSGTNTDGYGAVLALKKEDIILQGKKVLIIGSGGSARAIAVAVARENPSAITILSRRKAPATEIIRLIRNHNTAIQLHHSFLRDESGFLIDTAREADVIVQTTPAGMQGHGADSELSPLPFEAFRPDHTVFDIVYNPRKTPFVRNASKAGSRIVYGYKMLLYQGVKQFEIFTGQEAPVDVMEKALLKVPGV